MKRSVLVKIHLGVAALFLPFLVLMPLTGGLHLLKFQGGQEKSTAFEIAGPIPSEEAELEAFFREQFALRNLDFDFEYIRTSGNDLTFRPSSRVHYVATRTESGATVSRVDPSLLKRLLEVHKGHGPTHLRWVEIGFAAALLGITGSGIWLAATVPAYRRLLLLSFAVGCAVVVTALL